MNGLNWTEGKPTSEPIRCVGCRRWFVDWNAFETHGEDGACATKEGLARKGLVHVGTNNRDAVWGLNAQLD